MRIADALLLIILSTILSDSFCFDLKCEDDHSEEGRCIVSDLVVTNLNQEITSVNGNPDPFSMETTYTELIIRNQNVKFVPMNIAIFFPQLEKLEITNSSLEWLEQANIKDLTSLTDLNLDNNNLKIVEEGLFDFNTKLRTIRMAGNSLSYVYYRVFYDLINLQTIDLKGNPCTQPVYDDYYQRQYLTSNPYAYRSSIQDQLSAYCQSRSIYKKVFEARIKYIQLENEKLVQELTHQLKTCDGNLDAALMNFHLQKKLLASTTVTMDKPNDSPVINLTCENGLCVATDFKVPFSNLSIESELYKTQIIKSLKIHQQQTLFLPQNLDEHFPQLNELSVTESGLNEIDFNVFAGLNLSSLNLTHNKVPEIPVDTFVDLKHLRVLDLSFNKIHSLVDDVFASLKSLQQLYLNNNYLTSIQIEVVRNLESLNGLYLQSNRLKFISATLLIPLTSLKSADLLGNACINISYPTSSLVEMETTIIDNCIAPVELKCESYRTETIENVQNDSFCNVENLLIEYPKTKLLVLRNNDQDLHQSVEIIFVNKQSIKYFPFQLSQQFPNLKRIEVQESNLSALHSVDFVGFSALSEIVINNNNLSWISADTFDSVPQLELLNLSSNGIMTLPHFIFARLTKLHTLILSHNQIVTFMADFLPRKNVIDTFRVDNNQLENIETKTIRFLRRAKLIDLTGNVCIDMQFAKTENRTRALVELSGEIDLNCSADD